MSRDYRFDQRDGFDTSQDATYQSSTKWGLQVVASALFGVATVASLLAFLVLQWWIPLVVGVLFGALCVFFAGKAWNWRARDLTQQGVATPTVGGALIARTRSNSGKGKTSSRVWDDDGR